MRRTASVSAAAVLAAGLFVSGAPAQQRVVVDGDMWLSSTPEARRAFLARAANRIALETAYAKSKDAPQPAAGAMAGNAVEGMTLDQISDRITRWYEANPGRRDVPVMGVIWAEMVVPGAARP